MEISVLLKEREEFLNMLQFYIIVEGVIGLPEVGAGNLSKALEKRISESFTRASESVIKNCLIQT